MTTPCERISHGIWRPVGTAGDLTARTLALLTTCPPGTVVGGRAAARLCDWWLGSPDVHRIEVLTHSDAPAPWNYSHSRRDELLCRRRRLRPDEVEFVHGIPVTSAARTWIDLAETQARGGCVVT